MEKFHITLTFRAHFAWIQIIHSSFRPWYVTSSKTFVNFFKNSYIDICYFIMRKQWLDKSYFENSPVSQPKVQSTLKTGQYLPFANKSFIWKVYYLPFNLYISLFTFLLFESLINILREPICKKQKYFNNNIRKYSYSKKRRILCT